MVNETYPNGEYLPEKICANCSSNAFYGTVADRGPIYECSVCPNDGETWNLVNQVWTCSCMQGFVRYGGTCYNTTIVGDLPGGVQ